MNRTLHTHHTVSLPAPNCKPEFPNVAFHPNEHQRFTGIPWCVAAFRPHSAELIQAFNDLGFITMLTATPAVGVQVLAVGLAILADKRARPVFPRWVAHASFVCALGLQGKLLLVLARTGPFAWDGVIAGLLPFIFFPWCILMTPLLLRAIKQQETEEADVGLRVNLNKTAELRQKPA